MGKIIKLEEGLNILKEGVEKAKMILDGYPPSALFTPEEYMKYYDCIYYMCVQPQPYDFSVQLYQSFKRVLDEGISSRVLPSLVDKNGAPLLIELLHMWAKYKKMAKCLGGFFLYLDRHGLDGKNVDSLNDISVRCFHDLVCSEYYQKIQNAASSLICKDRDEKTLDKDLLNNVSTFFLEIGLGNTFYYDNFEKAILADAASYYSQLASEWLSCYSSAEYVRKVDWCLNEEKGRASQYLYQKSVEKLLQVVQWQLVGQTASKLIDKQKVESNHGSAAIQELLFQCANLNIGDGSTAP